MAEAVKNSPLKAFKTAQNSWEQVNRDKKPRTVIVTGHSDIDNSRAASLIAHTLDPAPTTTLIGQGRRTAPAPYDWTATALASHTPDNIPVSTDAWAWLTQNPRAASRLEPTALTRAAVTTVRHIMRHGPGLIIAESAQTLDPASLQLLTALASSDNLPVLILVIAHEEQPARHHTRTMQALLETDTAITTITDPVTTDTTTAAIAWAHYTRDSNNPHRAAAALNAAAALLTQGDTESAYQLLDECLPGTGGVSIANLLRHHTDTQQSDHTRPSEDLTSRERDILACLVQGMSNQQTARTLGISIRTVTVHVSNVLRKTGTASRTEVALWAIRTGATQTPKTPTNDNKPTWAQRNTPKRNQPLNAYDASSPHKH